MEMIFLTFVVQVAMGIFGGQMASSKLKLDDVRQAVKLVSGAVGGLVLGMLVGSIVGDDNSFFAALSDAMGGFAGGALATVIVARLSRRSRRR